MRAAVGEGFRFDHLSRVRQNTHISYVEHLEPTLIVINIGTNDLASPMCYA